MSSAAVMGIVLFVFFLVGFGVGIIVVIALSARKADKATRRAVPPTPPGKWPYLPEVGPNDHVPDKPPWWQERGGS